MCCIGKIMYREKLDTLFRRLPNRGDEIIENLKGLVKYQNFVIEEQIIIQARNNGVEIPNETIMQKDRQRIVEHDKAIDVCVNLNQLANRAHMEKIFDFNPTPVVGEISRYDKTDHAKVAYYVADFVNEYYNLGIQLERYDKALDSTTYEKINRISEKEWFGATQNYLPEESYDESRLDNAREIIHNRIEREDLHLDTLRDVIDKNPDGVDLVLQNDVSIHIEKNGDYDVTIETKRPLTQTSGILTDEISAGFEKEADNKVKARDILYNQLRSVVKQNGGISHQSVMQHGLDEER